jgi:hypothetical protein
MRLCTVVLCFLLFVGLAILIGCDSSGVTGDGDGFDLSSINNSDACLDCHSGDTATGNNVLGASAGYENSGHYQGPRTLAPAGGDHMYVFHGSNAMYANGGGCEPCHTHQGFVEWVATGSSSTVESASQPGCFTCHAPHETGNFTLRKSTSVALVDGTSTFDYGSGNLCVNCHLSRTDVATFLSATFPKSIKSYEGPHHGPQSDFIMGTNHWVYGGNSYNGVSVHATATANSCVTCHLYLPASRLSGTLELGGHGMYLASEVHGSSKDLVSSCLESGCHDTGSQFNPDYPGGPYSDFFNNNKTATANWDGDATTENKLDEIKGLRDTLIGYFGTGGNFTGGQAPLTASSGEWGRDWDFQSQSTGNTMTLFQAQSFWNFKIFMEDRSMGIHNPTFAAQILYDAIDNLNTNAGAGLTLGGTRP